MIEDVEDRDTVEGLVRERKRGGLASNAPGRISVEHRLRVIETDPGTVREVARELSLAAADVEHPGEALGDEAPGDLPVNVPCHRVAAEHRAREAHTARVLVVVGGDGLGRRARRRHPWTPMSGAIGRRWRAVRPVSSHRHSKEAIGRLSGTRPVVWMTFPTLAFGSGCLKTRSIAPLGPVFNASTATERLRYTSPIGSPPSSVGGRA